MSSLLFIFMEVKLLKESSDIVLNFSKKYDKNKILSESAVVAEWSKALNQIQVESHRMIQVQIPLGVRIF